MNRTEKKEYVDSLKAGFDAAEMVVITQQVGLSASEVSDFRTKVNASGATYRVTKNRLAKIAIKGTRYEYLEKLFAGPTAVAFSSDPIAAAKVTADFANENEKFKIVGGAMGDKELSEAEILQLAKLPSLDALRSQLIGLIQAPAGNIARVILAVPGQVARVFAARGRMPDDAPALAKAEEPKAEAPKAEDKPAAEAAPAEKEPAGASPEPAAVEQPADAPAADASSDEPKAD